MHRQYYTLTNMTFYFIDVDLGPTLWHKSYCKNCIVTQFAVRIMYEQSQGVNFLYYLGVAWISKTLP